MRRTLIAAAVAAASAAAVVGPVPAHAADGCAAVRFLSGGYSGYVECVYVADGTERPWAASSQNGGVWYVWQEQAGVRTVVATGRGTDHGTFTAPRGAVIRVRAGADMIGAVSAGVPRRASHSW